MPVIPAAQESEAGESLEPGRWRLQWAEIVPLHSNLGNKSETPSQKKKKRKKFTNVPTMKMMFTVLSLDGKFDFVLCPRLEKHFV